MNREPCSICGAELDGPDGSVCARCGTPRAALARSPTRGELMLERALERQLARVSADALLAQADAVTGSLLATDSEPFAALSHVDLEAAVGRVEELEIPSLATFDRMLEDPSASFAIGGLDLAQLVDRKGKEAAIVRRGLTFLKHQRYADAGEWWALQRQVPGVGGGRFDLVLQLLECVTYALAGDRARASMLKRAVKSHPAYRRPGGD